MNTFLTKSPLPVGLLAEGALPTDQEYLIPELAEKLNMSVEQVNSYLILKLFRFRLIEDQVYFRWSEVEQDLLGLKIWKMERDINLAQIRLQDTLLTREALS